MKTLRMFAFLLAIGAAFAGGYVYRAVKSASAGGGPKGVRKVLYWVDPMHPSYRSDKPGIAPDCGMKLEPVYADSEAAASAVVAPAVSAAGGPPGTVRITPEKQQLIGVKYGRVEAMAATRTIHTPGKVAIDERRIQHVHTKVEGWIDTVSADFTGKLVRKGEPLVTIYSPEMLATERELLLAAKAKQLMWNNPMPRPTIKAAPWWKRRAAAWNCGISAPIRSTRSSKLGSLSKTSRFTRPPPVT